MGSANSWPGLFGFLILGFLISKTEVFTLLRRSRPSPNTCSGHGKPEILSIFEDVGETALDRTCPRPPSPGLQEGAALAGRDLCRDRHNVGVAGTGGAHGRPGASSGRGAEPDPAPGCAQLSKGLWDTSLLFFFFPEIN